jgi:MAF protein
MKLILGSSSKTRKMVLKQLNLSFECIHPDIDETLLNNETVTDYVSRLSVEKAAAVLKKINKDEHFLIIGCDQVAHLDGEIYGKPENHAGAVAFLRKFSGKKVSYICSVTVLNTKNTHMTSGLSTTDVIFTELSEALIEKYTRDESIFECASGLKIEGMGPLLLKSFESHDPTGILGLPVLLLNQLISEQGLNLFDFCQ